MIAPIRPAFHVTWNGTEHVLGQPDGLLVKTKVVLTVAAVVNVDPPDGRMEKVATRVWLEVVQSLGSLPPLMHV